METRPARAAKRHDASTLPGSSIQQKAVLGFDLHFSRWLAKSAAYLRSTVPSSGRSQGVIYLLVVFTIWAAPVNVTAAPSVPTLVWWQVFVWQRVWPGSAKSGSRKKSVLLVCYSAS